MLLVARKNLLERTRLAISVGGVALSVFLISLLLSLYRGWDSRSASSSEVERGRLGRKRGQGLRCSVTTADRRPAGAAGAAIPEQ